MSSYQYGKSHCGDKTILRPSYLHNGISYTGKTTSLYWIGVPVYISALEYSWRKGSILWYLMPWYLALPGHQQECYWACWINGLIYRSCDQQFQLHGSSHRLKMINTTIPVSYVFSEKFNSARVELGCTQRSFWVWAQPMRAGVTM